VREHCDRATGQVSCSPGVTLPGALGGIRRVEIKRSVVPFRTGSVTVASASPAEQDEQRVANNALIAGVAFRNGVAVEQQDSRRAASFQFAPVVLPPSGRSHKMSC
jgi:hypothetical protein